MKPILLVLSLLMTVSAQAFAAEEEFKMPTCYDSERNEIPCELPFVKTAQSYPMKPACWKEGFSQGLSGIHHPLGFGPLKLRAIKDPYEIFACIGLKKDTPEGDRDFQCCMDGFYKGLETLADNLKKFREKEDKGESSPPSVEDRRIKSCLLSQHLGRSAAAKECKYFERDDNADPNHPKPCPNVDWSLVLYRGCYMVGFLADAQRCNCPIGARAARLLETKMPQIYDANRATKWTPSPSTGEQTPGTGTQAPAAK